MAFPVVESVTETAFGSAATAHLVAMPATVNADDLLLILIATHATSVHTTPSGWTLLYTVAGSSYVHGSAYIKKAIGDEDSTTVDVVSSVSRTGAAQAWRITAWSGTLTDVDASTATTGGSDSHDPPSHTTGWGGAEDNLWIAATNSGDDDVAVTGWPTNYVSNQTDTACGGGANNSGRIAAASDEVATDTEDPGAFTLASSEAGVMATIAIRPVVAAILLPGLVMAPYQPAQRN